MMSMDGKTNQKQGMLSILLAFYIDIPAVNSIIITVAPQLAGRIMSTLYLACIVMITLLALVYSLMDHRSVVLNKTALLLICTIVLAFITTQFVKGKSTLTVVNFIVFVAFPLISLQMINIDKKLFIKALMVIPSIGILWVNKLFLIDTNNYISMGTSYAFLASVLASLVYMVLLFKFEQAKLKLFYFAVVCVNVVYFIYLLLYGSRGPILSVVLCVLFNGCFRYNSENQIIEKRGVRILLLCVGILIVSINFTNILSFINGFLLKNNISIALIEKTLRILPTGGGIMNGRNEIITTAAEGILNSPIWGHGMSLFQYNTGINYPHNFLLQFLYDGGIILFLLILMPMILRIMRLWKNCTYDNYVMFTYMFFLTIPNAFFSGDIWENGKFWVFVGYLLSF